MRKRAKRHRSVTRQNKFMQYFRNHPLVVPITTLFVLVFITMSGLWVFGGQTIGASDSRVVRLYVDGQEQIVPTRAGTVKELLTRLDINVQDKDIVEPGLDARITADDFEVNVYKARPVLVVDGGKETVTVSAEPTPEEVAEDAGVKVYPEDRVETGANDVPEPAEAVQTGVVPEKIVINRATLVNLNLYGKQVEVRTHATTVGELLAEKNIQLNESDTVKPSADTSLDSNIQVFITRMGTKIDTEEEIIPMPIEYIDDPSLAAGVTRIKKAGENGRKLVTYEIELKNGREASRKVIQQIIASQPVKQIVIRGSRGIGGSNAQLLLKLRMCETGGNYRSNTGNGYYGAYQFSLPTWDSMGTGYMRPDLAPAAVQDAATLRLAYRSGFHSQFPGCSAKLGLPAYPN